MNNHVSSPFIGKSQASPRGAIRKPNYFQTILTLWCHLPWAYSCFFYYFHSLLILFQHLLYLLMPTFSLWWARIFIMLIFEVLLFFLQENNFLEKLHSVSVLFLRHLAFMKINRNIPHCFCKFLLMAAIYSESS